MSLPWCVVSKRLMILFISETTSCITVEMTYLDLQHGFRISRYSKTMMCALKSIAWWSCCIVLLNTLSTFILYIVYWLLRYTPFFQSEDHLCIFNSLILFKFLHSTVLFTLFPKHSKHFQNNVLLVYIYITCFRWVILIKILPPLNPVKVVLL